MVVRSRPEGCRTADLDVCDDLQIGGCRRARLAWLERSVIQEQWPGRPLVERDAPGSARLTRKVVRQYLRGHLGGEGRVVLTSSRAA
jgi:hypothetical protein